MSKLFVQFALCCAVAVLVVAAEESYEEKHRLQLHYSVPENWSNDPNGLIYYNGFYHLYYQYNPYDTKMDGDSIHWGHARSQDLVHWENMPIALYPTDKGVIFSGCAVLDTKNVTKFAPSEDEKNPTDVAMVALFTLVKGEKQSQGMAYSFDNGTTWTQYDVNPIIDNPGVADFRDPNIFEFNGKYYMTLAVNDHISFRTSVDLKNWTYVGEFGLEPSEGDKSGVWECPAIVTLEDEQNKKHDVLLVSENGDQKGSLFQYFVGQFNGTDFNSYNTSKISWAEDAIDNYAAVPYHNDPHGRVILIGWLSNWLYGDKIPTSTWRGQYTIPRVMSILTVNGEHLLAQWPVKEFDKQINQTWEASTPFKFNDNQNNLTQQIPFKSGLLRVDYEFDIGNVASGKYGLQFSNDLGEFVSFVFNVQKNIFEFDRTKSGNVSFHERFANKIQTKERISNNDSFSGCIILDVSAIEIYADRGLNVFSALFFPTKPFENVQLIGENDGSATAIVKKLKVSSLKSIWEKK